MVLMVSTQKVDKIFPKLGGLLMNKIRYNLLSFQFPGILYILGAEAR
jgi:hypothetical protein